MRLVANVTYFISGEVARGANCNCLAFGGVWIKKYSKILSFKFNFFLIFKLIYRDPEIGESKYNVVVVARAYYSVLKCWL